MRHPWTFITSHAVILMIVARERTVSAHAVALRSGMDVRSVQRIIKDLEGAGFVYRQRASRSNVYGVDLDRPMRHPGLQGFSVGEVLAACLQQPLGFLSTENQD